MKYIDFVTVREIGSMLDLDLWHRAFLKQSLCWFKIIGLEMLQEAE